MLNFISVWTWKYARFKWILHHIFLLSRQYIIYLYLYVQKISAKFQRKFHKENFSGRESFSDDLLATWWYFNSWLWRASLYLKNIYGFFKNFENFTYRNFEWQYEHSKGFSPVWIILWRVKADFCEKVFPHSSHGKGFSPVCVRKCVTEKKSHLDMFE